MPPASAPSASPWTSPAKQQVEDGTPRWSRHSAASTCWSATPASRSSHPVVEFAFAEWKKLLAIHLDGAFLTTRGLRSAHVQAGPGGSIIYMGSVHSKEASVLKAPYVTAKHGLIGLAKVVAKEGAAHGVRANVICPGFVRTPLVDKQIPEQAKELGISEQEVIKNVMLKETVDGEFTTVEDVAETALFFAAFGSNALTGQSHRRQPRLVHAVGQNRGGFAKMQLIPFCVSRAIRLRGGAQASRGSMSVPDRFLNSQYRRADDAAFLDPAILRPDRLSNGK